MDILQGFVLSFCRRRKMNPSHHSHHLGERFCFTIFLFSVLLVSFECVKYHHLSIFECVPPLTFHPIRENSIEMSQAHLLSFKTKCNRFAINLFLLRYNFSILFYSSLRLVAVIHCFQLVEHLIEKD